MNSKLEKTGSGNTTPSGKSVRREYLESLVSAFILALIVLTFLGRAFKIPSSSMVPTLRVGDRIFVNRFVYKFSEPVRGDLAVFVYPEDESRDFIKRIVGLPGEEVQIKHGSIFINGEQVESDNPVSGFNYHSIGRFGSDALLIPDKRYFVLGDNSENSSDSRNWGPVPEKNIVGRAAFVYFPFGHHFGRVD